MQTLTHWSPLPCGCGPTAAAAKAEEGSQTTPSHTAPHCQPGDCVPYAGIAKTAIIAKTEIDTQFVNNTYFELENDTE